MSVLTIMSLGDLTRYLDENPDKLLDHEMGYRKGYRQGFLAAVELLAAGAEVRQLRQFHDNELSVWWRGDCANADDPPSPIPWRQLRQQVLDRDEHKCVYCGADATHVDHVMPVSKGGAYELSNLRASCASCNMTKGTSTSAYWIKLAGRLT